MGPRAWNKPGRHSPTELGPHRHSLSPARTLAGHPLALSFSGLPPSPGSEFPPLPAAWQAGGSLYFCRSPALPARAACHPRPLPCWLPVDSGPTSLAVLGNSSRFLEKTTGAERKALSLPGPRPSPPGAGGRRPEAGSPAVSGFSPAASGSGPRPPANSPNIIPQEESVAAGGGPG